MNRDLLLTAAIFHDIGKLSEISSFPENDYTDDGNLLGHIFLGAEFVGKKMEEIRINNRSIFDDGAPTDFERDGQTFY